MSSRKVVNSKLNLTGPTTMSLASDEASNKEITLSIENMASNPNFYVLDTVFEMLASILICFKNKYS